MPYSVNQLAELAGVTVRTLHHYDAVGLLRPARGTRNGYRQYGNAELLRLQQILFFREIDLPLEEIKGILDRPGFDLAHALRDHRELIARKRKRLDSLLTTIDQTIAKLTKQTPMDDKDLYTGFSKQQTEAYAAEAKQRWGNTDAYKQSIGKYEALTPEQKLKMKNDADAFMREIADLVGQDPKSPAVQSLIAKHFEGLRFFYEPTLEIYRGLGTMYVEDKRFSAYFEKYHPDLHVFMRDAMHAFCDAKERG
jgi:DNA-binding transcriptional MerR regulator